MQAWRQYRAFQPPASVHLANVQGVFNETADVGHDVEAQGEEPSSAVDASTTSGRIEDTNAPTASPGHTSRAEDRPSPKSGLVSDETRERSTPVVPSIERTFTAIGDAGDPQHAEDADGSTPSPVTAAPEATVERQHDPSEPTPATTPSRRGSTLVASPIENPEKSPDYVTFEPNDPQNPQNWSRWYKAFVLAQLTFLTLSLTFASAASAPAEAGFMEEFGAGPITATAGTGLFLIGCGLGALPTAPLSEREYLPPHVGFCTLTTSVYGRLPVYCITVFFATLFELGCALAPTAPALLVLRFFAGLVSSAPLSNAGGTLFDIGNPISRTIQFPIFASAGFLAPILAPVMGGYVVTNPAYGWRWMYWICTIWNGLAFLLVAFFMPETLAQAILKMKAQRLRKVTGNKGWRSKMEDSKFWPTLVVTLKRPFQMLVQEPVLQFFILYLTGEQPASTWIMLTPCSGVHRALWLVHRLPTHLCRPRSIHTADRLDFHPRWHRLHLTGVDCITTFLPISEPDEGCQAGSAAQRDIRWQGGTRGETGAM